MSTPQTISPAALDTDTPSTEDLGARLASEYESHLAVMDQRLEAALAACGFDGAVIFAGDQKPVFRDDAVYPFSIEPYFKAWLPLTDAPGSFLRLVPGQRPTLVYTQIDDFWHEPPSDPSGYWTSHFDIRVARTSAEARQLSGNDGRWVAIGEGAGAQLGSTTQPAANDPAFLSYLDFHRACKTSYELLCMRAAQTIAVSGHSAVAAAFSAGIAEFDLQQIYCGTTQQRETELPYPNIIALNEHAATLHYQHLRTQPPAVTRSLLIDAGAAFHGYAADITRTYATSADDFGTLVESMEALQQRVCLEVRAGLDFVELHLLAHRLLGAVLREHDLIKCSAEEAVATGITRGFLPHGLGHLLGLQVHDAGGRQTDPEGTIREPPQQDPFLRLTRVLQPGFVVTIEPGLYFIPALLRREFERCGEKLNRSKIERLIPFGGIRIEDDVEVTSDGSRNLTREAFAAATPRAHGCG